MPDYAKYKDRLLDYLATKGVEVKEGICRCFSGWHEDKNPSCKVTKNAFRCYSCGTFGDIYDAVMLIENLPPDKEAQFNFLEKHFSRYYKCASCGGIFEKGWADSEAVNEQKMIFPGIPLCDCELVCEDCFKKITNCVNTQNFARSLI
jgi:hypothetical protein